jgi:hypothetical protein
MTFAITNIKIVCGKPSFVKAMRNIIQDTMLTDNFIKLIEVEFQPKGCHKEPVSDYIKKMAINKSVAERKEIELQELNKGSKIVLRKNNISQVDLGRKVKPVSLV